MADLFMQRFLKEQKYKHHTNNFVQLSRITLEESEFDQFIEEKSTSIRRRKVFNKADLMPY